jgi:hypothetical protein
MVDAIEYITEKLEALEANHVITLPPLQDVVRRKADMYTIARSNWQGDWPSE